MPPLPTMQNRPDPAMAPPEAPSGNCRTWAQQAHELAKQARSHQEAGNSVGTEQSTALAQVYATLASSPHLDSVPIFP